jgi:Fungal N-terminal domain of STAND proteins
MVRMAEPIGVASGILALTIFAYNTSKTLYEAVASFKSQRKTITDLQADLGSLIVVVNSIRDQVQASRETDKFEPLRQPLQCCATICQEMRGMLSICTAYGKGNRDSVRDWLNMQYREKSFEDMKKRLGSYQSTLCIAFALMNR